jgi:hypothetical protein
MMPMTGIDAPQGRVIRASEVQPENPRPGNSDWGAMRRFTRLPRGKLLMCSQLADEIAY